MIVVHVLFHQMYPLTHRLMRQHLVMLLWLQRLPLLMPLSTPRRPPPPLPPSPHPRSPVILTPSIVSTVIGRKGLEDVRTLVKDSWYSHAASSSLPLALVLCRVTHPSPSSFLVVIPPPRRARLACRPLEIMDCWRRMAWCYRRCQPRRWWRARRRCPR